MTLISAQPGEGLFSEIIFRELASDRELNLSGLAARMSMPEQSLRGWRDAKSSPRFDHLAKLARRRGAMSDRMLVDAAQTFVGPRALVMLADNFDLPASVRPPDVLTKAIEALHELTEFIEAARDRASDGVICADDAAALATEASDVKRVLNLAVLIGQRCAGTAPRR